jgi:hypothetical protein
MSLDQKRASEADRRAAVFAELKQLIGPRISSHGVPFALEVWLADLSATHLEMLRSTAFLLTCDLIRNAGLVDPGKFFLFAVEQQIYLREDFRKRMGELGADDLADHPAHFVIQYPSQTLPDLGIGVEPCPAETQGHPRQSGAQFGRVRCQTRWRQGLARHLCSFLFRRGLRGAATPLGPHSV